MRKNTTQRRAFNLNRGVCGTALALIMSSAAQAQSIDVVFTIDESGSMGDDIADIRANVNTIFGALPTGSAVGLLGYGGPSSANHHPNNGLPHVHTAVTTVSTVFTNALNQLVANGGYEPGYLAVQQLAQDQVHDQSMQFRGGPFCNILVTDETLNQGNTTEQQAIDAMNNASGVFFGILPSGLFASAQALATETGGQLFDLTQFRQNATPVIEAVLAACVEAVSPIFVDIKPTSCPNPFRLRNRGVVPVAILGTEDFQVSAIQPESVKLNGECAALRWSTEDVATPYSGGFSEPPLENECTTAGADGYTDLSLKFDSACVAATQSTVTQREARFWTLTGTYTNDQGNSVTFEAQDVVRVMP